MSERSRELPKYLDDASSSDKAKRRERNKYARSMETQRDDLYELHNIAPVPPCQNPERREACKHSLKLFCETYLASKFTLRWGPDHIKLIQTMEDSILKHTSQIAYAFPRGFGKTTLAESFIEWAMLYGHRRYTIIVAGKKDLAVAIMQSMVLEFEINNLLSEDFPEVCYPIRMLDGSFNRTKHQHVDGSRTRMLFKTGEGYFVFPTVEGSSCSGSKVQCFGIGGYIRGLRHTIASTSETIRPDLVLIDDPQSDYTAKSASTIALRERLIDGAILGLAGPNRSITAIMPCTVIRPNDLAERFLDREKRPEWQGQRTKLLKSFPSRMDLWAEYNEIRKESLNEQGNIGRATAFYEERRAEMDEGAVIAWEDRFDPMILEVSAIQSAMNLYYRNPVSFASEYQNEPLTEDTSKVGVLTLDKLEIIKRISGLPRNVAPLSTLYVTTGVDIQKNIIYYVTTAWGPDFGGLVIDYGTYPKQHSWDGWTGSHPQIPLGHDRPGLSVGPNIYRGLCALRDNVFSRPVKREGTEEVAFTSRVLIDAGWHESTQSVFDFCRDSNVAGSDVYMPSLGRGIIASMIPMMEWQLKQGEIRKWNSRILPRTMKSGMGRHASYDTNSWKSFIVERLSNPLGSDNNLMLFGPSGDQHEAFAAHCASEEGVLRSGRGRQIREWSLTDKHADNHLFDCLIMSAVAANLSGLEPHAKTIEFGDFSFSVPTQPKTRKKLDASRVPKVEV